MNREKLLAKSLELGYKIVKCSNRTTDELVLSCSNNHLWKTTYNRFVNAGCTCYWCHRFKYYEKDVIGHLNSIGYRLMSSYKRVGGKITVACPKGHIWETIYKRILEGKRCLSCYGHMKYTLEGVTKIVEADKYSVIGSYVGYHKPLKLRCPEGHVWETTLKSFLFGYRCSICNRLKQKYTIEEVSETVRKRNYKLLGRYKNVKKPLVLLCPKIHEWTTTFDTFLQGANCPKCNINKAEEEIKKELDKITNTVIYRTRKVISPFELDFYLPNEKIAIEYCGIHWHSVKPQFYHLNKVLMCEKKGIRLITIFEDEWLNNKQLICWKVAEILNKIKTSKCLIKEISKMEASRFFDANSANKIEDMELAYGAFQGQDLIFCCVVNKSNHLYYASKIGNLVNPLKDIIKQFKKPLFVEVDYRYTFPSDFQKLGFMIEKNSEPIQLDRLAYRSTRKVYNCGSSLLVYK